MPGNRENSYESNAALLPGERGEAGEGGEQDEAGEDAELQELGDPEGAPGGPTATLAAGAALPPLRRGRSAEILQLAWPAMLSMTMVAAAGLLDVGMVGRLGAEAQAAVGIAQQLFAIAQSALFALSFAAVALMSRAIGAGRPANARSVLAASLVLALGVAALLFALLGANPGALFTWLGADAKVAQLGVPYMRLVMASNLMTACALMLESGMRADKDTLTPMLVMLALTIAKVALNGVFIFGWLGGPELGVSGAGLATVLSQGLALCIFIAISLARNKEAPCALRPADFRNARAYLAPLLRVAVPGVVERLAINLAIILYFKLLGAYGTEVIAAYTIGVRVLAFSWIPGTGYSQAVATSVGQALGAQDKVGARRAGRRAALLALVTALVMGGAGIAFRETLASVFTVDALTAQVLIPFMLFLSIAQPFIQLHFTLAGAFRGAGDTVTPLVAALIGNWLLRVPLAFAASFFGAELTWLWAALIIDHCVRAGWLSYRFFQGDWRNTKRAVMQG